MVYEKYKKEAIERYNASIDKYGDKPKGLDWHSKKSQEVRFSNIIKPLDIGDFDNLLDIGCGFGDLFEYVSQNTKPTVSYIGLDINHKAIEIADKRFRDSKNAYFYCKDFLAEIGYKVLKNNNFAYVFMVDVLDTLVEDNWQIVKGMLFKAFKVANKAVVASFLSSYADEDMKTTDKQFYIEPEKLFRYCKSLTKWVDMKHSHLPHNVIVYLYKEQR